MTNQESKLAKKLERRLQEHALKKKEENNYRPQRKPEGLGAIKQMIQRAQFYTGDA